MPEFLIRAFLGGFGVAVVAGPIGCFIVWRRMAYFGDTLSHSALLGVALGFLLGINPTLAVIVICGAVAVLLVVMQQQRILASDTLLGILAHSALSLGLVTVAFMETFRLDLVALLFGDILAITTGDLGWVYGGGAFALITLVALWRPLLAITVHEELARVEGVPVLAVRLGFMLLIAVVIAVALKIVGILLITSLMIIPAATARRFTATPEQMAVAAALIGAVAVGAGLWGSWLWDTPTGPSIVVAAFVMFVLALVVPSGRALARP